MAIPPQFKKKAGTAKGKTAPDVEACVESLLKQGKPKPQAFAICNAKAKKKSSK